jgi:hypothetical protein
MEPELRGFVMDEYMCKQRHDWPEGLKFPSQCLLSCMRSIRSVAPSGGYFLNAEGRHRPGDGVQQQAGQRGCEAAAVAGWAGFMHRQQHEPVMGPGRKLLWS